MTTAKDQAPHDTLGAFARAAREAELDALLARAEAGDYTVLTLHDGIVMMRPVSTLFASNVEDAHAQLDAKGIAR